MNTEKRIYQASMLAGATDITIGIMMHWLGWTDWWWAHFHTFGILGIGMLAYGAWHRYLYRRATITWKDKRDKKYYQS